MTGSDLRVIEVYSPTKHTWHRIDGMRLLKDGDRFRVFEANGQPVRGVNGYTEYIAQGSPYQAKVAGHQLSTWTILCKATESIKQGGHHDRQ